MPRVIWATVATSNPMGQQHYEVEIQKALRAVADERWDFVCQPVSSLRHGLPHSRRSPVGLAQRAPRSLGRAIGALTYRRSGIVHRFDLRLPPAPGREILTVHDLAPLRFDDEGTLPKSTAASLAAARTVICPSEFAANEIRTTYNADATVIPLGLSDPFRAPVAASDDRLDFLGVRVPFVLHAGGATARKNLSALAGAWRHVESRAPTASLVMCGPPDERRDRLVEDLPRVLRLGKVSHSDLVGLMCRASAVVVPSRYEGFGLPALEAMACETPVVAARAASLPEVCGDCADLVEPTAEGIADGLLRCLLQPAQAEQRLAGARRRALHYSWESAARAHLQVYASVAGMTNPDATGG